MLKVTNKIIVLMILVWSASAVAENSVSFNEMLKDRNESIEFEGQEYSLSWIDVNQKNITNEYLLPGTTLTQWNSMIATRQFGGIKEIKEILPIYLEQMKPLIASKPGFFKDDTLKTNHIVIELLLMSPDRSYVEYDLYLFKETDKGVVAYQIAQRLPFDGKLDVNKQVRNRSDRMRWLAINDFSHYEK